MTILTTLPLVLAAASAPEGTAAELLARVETGLAGATGLSLRATISMEKEDPTAVDVELSIAGSALRWRTWGRIDGEPADITAVTKGATLALRGAEGFFGDRQGATVPESFATDVARAVARMGAISVLIVLDDLKLERTSDAFSVGDATLAGEEEVGGRLARVVRYALRVGDVDAGEGLELDARIWIDAETQLPLRRVLTFSSDGMRVTETYGHIDLSASFPEGHFRAP